ncbi:MULTISPECIES: prepilin peptidase [Alicyclobacillus]|uniref:A24 family peptidase n=1 Tax=Alicyclobacillus sendaiensis PA2 TaxID=3029425 RepID=A0ABT6Y2T7_ALISE|nr:MULTISPECIES: A24 family peptidase [Alicyclobacillus]MCL6488412.1 prepilin peptidase [Alicyclobacillus mali (ex Roth et al. 2021)]MDI9261184.1 A24 family peptidase [Alicyclobacillus sendaiensis PA2]
MVLYALLWLFLLACLLEAALHDLRTETIPWWLTICGSVVGVTLHALFQGVMGGLNSLIACAVWFALAELLWRVSPIGGGDLNLLAMSAAYTGLVGPVLIYLLAGIVQIGVYVAAFARGDMRLQRPFAPAILGGACLMLLWQLTVVIK